MTQAQLDVLRTQFNIFSAITMRALKPNELLDNALEGMDEIPFLTMAFECKVRLPLALFVRRFLSQLPLHPFQVSLDVEENCLALYITWHKAYGQDPIMEELQACFRIKSPNNKSITYYPYST